MLNRSDLLGQLSNIQGKMFSNYSSEYELLITTWKKLINDPEFPERVATGSKKWMLPTWTDDLKTIYPDPSINPDYTVIAADGSQIYPDRHSGTLCSLVNIGIVTANYQETASTISLDTKPYVHLFEEKDWLEAIDIVNCRRQELEFKHALQQALNTSTPNPIVLFDGSLIFWHLEKMEEKLKETYLSRYLALLDHYYKKKIPIAGYISLPKSKELVNLVRVHLSDSQDSESSQVDHMLDTHVAQACLEPFERTILFQNHSPIIKHYPQHLIPYFFYLHVGMEIVRIEIPQWIAQDETAVNNIMNTICDQARKGFGYPVALSEAHEQAVVKGPDRDFFYQSINDLGHQQKQMIAFSLKQAKKRIVSV